MKGNFHSLIITLAIFIKHCAQQTCNPPFTAVSNYNGSYCVKCDSTCLTCFDDSVGGCVTCRDNFTLNQNSSYCIPPDDAYIHTVESSYKYYGFTRYGNWTGASSTDCQYTTVLIPTTPTTLLENVNYLGRHYKLRIVVSAWWFIGATNTDILMQVFTPTGGNLLSKAITFASSQTTSNNSKYCTGSYATNIDTGTFNGASTSYVTVRFSSSSSGWGIR